MTIISRLFTKVDIYLISILTKENFADWWVVQNSPLQENISKLCLFKTNGKLYRQNVLKLHFTNSLQ